MKFRISSAMSNELIFIVILYAFANFDYFSVTSWLIVI